MAALGIGASATEIARTADEFKVLEARIGLVTSKSGNFTQAFEGVKRLRLKQDPILRLQQNYLPE